MNLIHWRKVTTIINVLVDDMHSLPSKKLGTTKMWVLDHPDVEEEEGNHLSQGHQPFGILVMAK